MCVCVFVFGYTVMLVSIFLIIISVFYIYNICFIMWEEIKYVCLVKLDVGRTLNTSGVTFAGSSSASAWLALSSPPPRCPLWPREHVVLSSLSTFCRCVFSFHQERGMWLGETPVLPLPQHRGLSSEGVPTKCKLPSLLSLDDGGLNFHVKYFFIFPSKGERTVNSSVPTAITNILSVLYRLTPQTLFMLQY